MSIYQELKDSFKFGSTLTKLLYINIIAFISFKLVFVFFWATGNDAQFPFSRWLCAPAYFPSLLYKPWTVITYMFYHEDFLHIAFNMLGLYWFGKLFLDFLNKRQLVGIYLLGGISGYILFSLGYYFIPALQEHLLGARILGASAAVFAILSAVAFYRPNYTIYLMFIGPAKLKYIALVYILLDVLMMASGNAGGHISHLGGVLFGWLFALQYSKGRDVTNGINGIIDYMVTMLKPRKNLKVSHKKPSNDLDYNLIKNKEQKDIDSILEKISKAGYESLSKDEKEKLFNMSKKK